MNTVEEMNIFLLIRNRKIANLTGMYNSIAIVVYIQVAASHE